MLIGYARVSKSDGSQSLDLQHDALHAAGVVTDNVYDDRASGSRDDRPGLAACLKSLRDGDILVYGSSIVWGERSPTWSARCKVCRIAASACASSP